MLDISVIKLFHVALYISSTSDNNNLGTVGYDTVIVIVTIDCFISHCTSVSEIHELTLSKISLVAWSTQFLLYIKSRTTPGFWGHIHSPYH